MNELAQPPALAPPSGTLPLIQLRDAETAWVVSGGRVHVFAMQLKDGMQVSARRYLFTVDAPGVIFPMTGGPKALGLIAVPLPGTRVEQISPERLWKRPDIEAAVDQWISCWMAGCVRYLQNRPKREMAASFGKSVALSANAVIDGGQEVVWYRAERGEGVLFDSESIGGAGPALFPLAAGGWARAFDEMQLTPWSTSDLLKQGELPGALDDFLVAVQRSLATVLNFALVDEAMRIDRRNGRLATDFRRIMGELGSLVGGHAQQKAAKAANQTLFSAVHAVATRIGVMAQMPASVRQSEADVEPALDDILRASGLRSRPVVLSDGWWTQSLGSLLVYQLSDQRPLALLDEGGRGYVVEDPVAGTRQPLTAALAAKLSPHAFCLYQPLPDIKLKLSNVVVFGLQGCRNDMLAILASAVLVAWTGSLPALAVSLIFDTLIPQRMSGLVWQMGLALLLMAMVRALFTFAGNISFARLRARASARLKAGLWDRLLRQPMAFYGRFTAPDLSMRLSSVENIVASMHSVAQQSLMTLGMLVSNLIMMLWLSPTAALPALALIVLFIAAVALAAWAQTRAFKHGEQAEGLVATLVHALTNGVRKLRLAGAEDRAFIKWGERFTRSHAISVNVRRVGNAFAVFSGAFNIFSLAAVFAVIALLNKESVGVGAFFGFVTAFGLTTMSLGVLGRMVLGIAAQLASAPYFQPILDAIPERQARKTSPGQLSGAVDIVNLAFRYPGAADAVLKGIQLKIAPGEFVALVGPTGCGKSTLVKLLLGLEAPTAGAILYDERDMAGLDVDALRRQMGVVLQRPQLVPTTLFDNIRGTANVGEEEVWEAARLAGIAADIEAMPMKLHTLVVEGAHTLSGGQLQRIAIARAIIRKPAFLILDEATSALDNMAQAEITRNLAGLACTRIVVAHRLSTVMGADRIVVLADGRVAESGTYDELMARDGVFAQMGKRQQVK